MRPAIFTATILFIVLTAAQQRLSYLEPQPRDVTVEQLIQKFTELQPEIYRNVFRHFINDKIQNWRNQGTSVRDIREKVLELITDAEGPLFANLSQYMQKRLFEKLEIGLLTESLQQEIVANPDNFYLTFDIYDLLFD